MQKFFTTLEGAYVFRQKMPFFEFEREKYIPLHMFFVFFSIDVIYLDKNYRVVEIKKNLKPFWFYNPKKKAKFIIEASAGVIDETFTEPGDHLMIKH